MNRKQNLNFSKKIISDLTESHSSLIIGGADEESLNCTNPLGDPTSLRECSGIGCCISNVFTCYPITLTIPTFPG
jgi:hypothetical protein